MTNKKYHVTSTVTTRAYLKHKPLYLTSKTWYQAIKAIFMHWEGLILHSNTERKRVFVVV